MWHTPLVAALQGDEASRAGWERCSQSGWVVGPHGKPILRPEAKPL